MTRALLLICAAMVCVLNVSRADTNDFFAQGVTAAQAGNFSDAAAAFGQSAKQRPAAGTFLNLGIVEWQRGHAGAAILAWERAGWIYPFDPRAKQNLKFARTAAQLNAPDLKWHESASLWLPPNAWVWLAGASLWLAVGALTLPRFFRWRKAGWQQWLAALGFGVFFFCLAANAGIVSRTNIGFVLKRNAPLLLVPVKTSEVTTTLAAGEPVRKIRTRGEYHLVQTAYGTGWMEQKHLGLVNGE
jgi:tetratricopeptide (TPR) repeat protein